MNEPCDKTYPNPCESIADLEVTMDSKGTKPEVRGRHKDVIPEAENLWTWEFPGPSPLEQLQAGIKENIETQKEKDKNNPPPNSIQPDGKVNLIKRGDPMDITKHGGKEVTLAARTVKLGQPQEWENLKQKQKEKRNDQCQEKRILEQDPQCPQKTTTPVDNEAMKKTPAEDIKTQKPNDPYPLSIRQILPGIYGLKEPRPTKRQIRIAEGKLTPATPKPEANAERTETALKAVSVTSEKEEKLQQQRPTTESNEVGQIIRAMKTGAVPKEETPTIQVV